MYNSYVYRSSSVYLFIYLFIFTFIFYFLFFLSKRVSCQDVDLLTWLLRIALELGLYYFFPLFSLNLVVFSVGIGISLFFFSCFTF